MFIPLGILRLQRAAAVLSACPSEFQEIVGGTNQTPLAGNFGLASQKKLSKAARLFNLPEYRFDHLLA